MADAAEQSTGTGAEFWLQLLDQYGVSMVITALFIVLVIMIARVLVNNWQARLRNERKREELELLRLDRETAAAEAAAEAEQCFEDGALLTHPFFGETANAIAVSRHMWLGDQGRTVLARDITIVVLKTWQTGLLRLIKQAIASPGGVKGFARSSAELASKMDKFYVWLRTSAEVRLVEEYKVPKIVTVKYSRAQERHTSIMRKMLTQAAYSNVPENLRLYMVLNSFLAAVFSLQSKVEQVIRVLNGDLKGVRYKGFELGPVQEGTARFGNISDEALASATADAKDMAESEVSLSNTLPYVGSRTPLPGVGSGAHAAITIEEEDESFFLKPLMTGNEDPEERFDTLFRVRPDNNP